MPVLLLALAFLAGAGLLWTGAVIASRRERRRSRRLAEHVSMEAHIEQLTTRTLRAMRQAASDYRRHQR